MNLQNAYVEALILNVTIFRDSHIGDRVEIRAFIEVKKIN